MKYKKLTRRVKEEILRLGGWERFNEEDSKKIWIREIENKKNERWLTVSALNDLIDLIYKEIMNDPLIREYLDNF